MHGAKHIWSGELTDDMSENHIDKAEPDDKLVTGLTMLVMKTQIKEVNMSRRRAGRAA